MFFFKLCQNKKQTIYQLQCERHNMRNFENIYITFGDSKRRAYIFKNYYYIAKDQLF